MAITVFASFALLLGSASFAQGSWGRRERGGVMPRGGASTERQFRSYDTNSRNSTPHESFGAPGQTLQVNPGVTRWLNGEGPHDFFGNINNYGNIIVSQTNGSKVAGGLTSDYHGQSTTDGNLLTGFGSLISLNDYASLSPPTYDWALYTMQNQGALQWCGRGDNGGATYQLSCQKDCYNYGLIDWGQYFRNGGGSFTWRNRQLYPPGATNVTNTYNEGLFRITNIVYHSVQNVLGGGCYEIGSNATLYLEDGSGYYQNPNLGPTFPDQTIAFANSTGCLHMDTQVYSHNSNFGPHIYNFGPGNSFEFSETLSTSAPFRYDSSAGVLTCLMSSGNSVYLKIGTGYDASQFYTANHPTSYNTAGYNAVFYRGSIPPQTIPSKCSTSVNTCADPAITAAAQFRSTTTTTTTVYLSTPTPQAANPVMTGLAKRATSTSPNAQPGILGTTVGPNQCVCRPRPT